MRSFSTLVFLTPLEYRTLDCLRQVQPDVPIIMVTGNTDVELARDTLKRGAFDYIMKPFDLNRLARVVEIAPAS